MDRYATKTGKYVIQTEKKWNNSGPICDQNGRMQKKRTSRAETTGSVGNVDAIGNVGFVGVYRSIRTRRARPTRD